MQIVIITPARSSSRSGNGTTTTRWARILRELGHDVQVAHRYDGEAADLMIALHAWRSADSIQDFRERYPERPLIVALSGTDIYDYIDRDPAPTLRSLACADRLVALQELARRRVPARFRPKVRVVYQSAPRLLASGSPADAQLRRCGDRASAAVKDPFRAAKATRSLPPPREFVSFISGPPRSHNGR